MQGIYRDTLKNVRGCVCFEGEWTPNTIVDSAWPLIAGLLKNDPVLGGVLYFAVGAGDPAWDGSHTAPSPAATQLHNEIHRQAVPAETIVYLDENANPAPRPTNHIEINASFSWPAAGQTLREFALFGGDASEARDSGFQINYVIHPSLYLEPGSTLTRRVRLTLRPEIGQEWLTLPQHWLRQTSIENVDGVGETYIRSLKSAGIETIGQLADTEPTTLRVGIVLMKQIELWAKARVILRTAAALSPVTELLDRRAWDVIVTPAPELAAAVGADEQAVARLRERLCALQLALDNRFLQEVTVGALAQAL